MQRSTISTAFERVGPINPERDSSGRIIEVQPQTNQPLHKYGGGPFCRFRIAQESNWQQSGVYVLTLNGVAHYVGECKSLSMIWRNVGHIAPRAVQTGGQQTFCRLNTLILEEAKQGSELVLWFQPVEDAARRSALKAELVESRNPAWNLPVRTARANPEHPPSHSGTRQAGSNQPQMTSPRSTRSAPPQPQSLRRFSGLQFSYVGRIQPERNANGEILEETPHTRYRGSNKPALSRYGKGPFCRFRIAQGQQWQCGGVYVVAQGDAVRYVGEAVNLERRWGAAGYGQISPRNCFVGGQDTNCRINNLLLLETKTGGQFDLWFHSVGRDKNARLSVESLLMASLQPPWNR